MKHTRKTLSILVLAVLLALTFVTPASAFEGRNGDSVVIPAGQVVNDDLYVTARQFTLEGTVKGDLVVFAQMMTINGKVDGDLLAAGQTVVLNGQVTGSARLAGAVIFIGGDARVGGDLVVAGYSLEGRAGSTVGRDVVFAGGQALLAGDVTRNLLAATASLDLRGDVGGNVKAEVGEANQPSYQGPMFMPQSVVQPPSVRPGLTIDPAAKIGGDLQYTQTQDLTFPAGVVAGGISRTAPAATSSAAPPEQTLTQKVGKWSLGFLRGTISLLLVGLLLLWLFPSFLRGLADGLRAKPWPSLGWGVLTWVGFFLALFLVIFVMIVGGILFGVLTLGQLSGTILWLGILTLLAMVIGFVLVTSFVAKLAVGTAIGRWVFVSTKSPLAENRYLPMVVGVLITAAVIALLSFPVIPGIFGWLLNLAVVLFGLGAIWVWGRQRMAKKPA